MTKISKNAEMYTHTDKSNKDKNFITNKALFMIWFIITIIALIIRFEFYDTKNYDYIHFLKPWFDYLKANGGIRAIDSIISDYNVPYLTILAILTYIPINSLYLIKTVSVVFDITLALCCVLVVKKMLNNNMEKMLITYLLVLFLPTVFINSSKWGQCDSIYTTFIILALYLLIDKKYISSIICYGFAFAFKLQSIFILPVYVYVFLKDKKMIKKLVYAPLVILPNLLLSLPYLIIGDGTRNIFGVYKTQVTEYVDRISSNISNIYHLIFFKNDSPAIYTNNKVLFYGMIILTLAIFFVMLVLILKKKVALNSENILNLALWSVVICVFFLPCMHDRYIYIANVLSIVICVITKNCRITAYIQAISLQLISLIHCLFLLNTYIPTTLLFLLVVIIATKRVFSKDDKDNLNDFKKKGIDAI